MSIKIEVKRKHIEQAKNKIKSLDICQFCPVALAIKEKLHKTAIVGDSGSIEIFIDRYTKKRYKVTSIKDCNKVDKFIKNFDTANFNKLREISFTIERT